MAIGDIIRVIESLEFDPDYSDKPDIIHVSGNIYAIAYEGPDVDGWLKTVSISEDGLTLSVKASLEFDTLGPHPEIIHISGNVYAIAYTGPGAPVSGWLKTVTISEDGLTLALTGASLEFYIGSLEEKDIIHISGNVYAIAYQDVPDYDGWLKTVTISDDGLTLALTGASLEFDTGQGREPAIIHISGNVYAIAYEGPNSDGWLKTVTISEDGLTLALTGASLEFDPESGDEPAIIHISGTIYAIAYKGPGSDGWLKTVSISDDGLTLALTGASLEFDEGYCGTPKIILVAANVYAIAYYGPVGTGLLKTVSISEDGLTLALTGSSLEFDPSLTRAPDIIHVSGNVYAIAYRGPDGDGWLKTVEIETVAPTVAPTVSTNPASAVGQTTATPNGTLDNDGGEACDCSFEYGETTDYGSTTATQSKTTSETFSQEVRGLRPGGILYHFRAKATNSAGTSYGVDRTFRTEALSAEAHQALGRGYALGRHGL